MSDQGCAATKVCTHWICKNAPLVKKGRYWVCSNCDASYGESAPHPDLRVEVVNLEYFKLSGKFYSHGVHKPKPNQLFHEIVADVEALAKSGDLPGLMRGHSPFIVYGNAQGVPFVLLPVDEWRAYIAEGE